MRVGTALPVTIEGVTRDTILSWAREAEAAGYSSLAVPDRLAWDNLDPLLSLAAAGAVTERIGLLSNILITPLRSTHVLAKEIGTLTALAPGRVVLGLGIGARPNDYALAGLPFERRGAVMDTQLAELTRLFAGERDADGHRIGPPPVGPVQILIGGASPNAVNRILRWGHGFIGGAVNAHITGLVAQGLRQAFAGAGRTDAPRIVADVRFASSEEEGDWADQYVDRYQQVGGPPPEVASPLYRGEAGVRRALEDYAAAGADELILTPCCDQLDELHWLTGTLGRLGVRDGTYAATTAA
jgi:alkanesulfonate monooxygenase SsuD/methylene tetrahydromethanopterin reductase-like flavin-dependent oxidoreductase (luciferase family)